MYFMTDLNCRRQWNCKLRALRGGTEVVSRCAVLTVTQACGTRMKVDARQQTTAFKKIRQTHHMLILGDRQANGG